MRENEFLKIISLLNFFRNVAFQKDNQGNGYIASQTFNGKTKKTDLLINNIITSQHLLTTLNEENTMLGVIEDTKIEIIVLVI